MNAYWVALPFLILFGAYTLHTRFWGGAIAIAVLVAFDVFAGVIVTGHGIFPVG
jgi:uncharacterized membrane protein